MATLKVCVPTQRTRQCLRVRGGRASQPRSSAKPQYIRRGTYPFLGAVFLLAVAVEQKKPISASSTCCRPEWACNSGTIEAARLTNIFPKEESRRDVFLGLYLDAILSSCYTIILCSKREGCFAACCTIMSLSSMKSMLYHAPGTYF